MTGGKKPTCVIICGGKGKRLLPITNNMPKSLVPIKGKPILAYIVDYCKKFSDNFVFIFEKDNTGLEEFVKTLSINSKCIIEEEPKGIANALLLTEKFVKNKFIVSLGDCIYNGNFIFPDDADQGFGVVETDNINDIRRSYSVEMTDGKLNRVIEKPTVVTNNLCGMGFYLFNKNVFDYIRTTKPSERTGKVEITDVIQSMISSGEKIKPLFFNGKYLNITYPEDLKKAEEIIS